MISVSSLTMRKNAILMGQLLSHHCLGMDKVPVKSLIIKMMKCQFRLGERQFNLSIFFQGHFFSGY